MTEIPFSLLCNIADILFNKLLTVIFHYFVQFRIGHRFLFHWDKLDIIVCK